MRAAPDKINTRRAHTENTHSLVVLLDATNIWKRPTPFRSFASWCRPCLGEVIQGDMWWSLVWGAKSNVVAAVAGSSSSFCNKRLCTKAMQILSKHIECVRVCACRLANIANYPQVWLGPGLMMRKIVDRAKHRPQNQSSSSMRSLTLSPTSVHSIRNFKQQINIIIIIILYLF